MHPSQVSGLSRKNTLILLPILLATILFISPGEIPRVHALTGEVCLADPTTVNLSSPCQSSLPVFSGPSGQQIKIGVYISGSDPMDGFDITLLTNQSFLVPAYVSTNTVDLTNTVLIGTPIIVDLCVDGQLVTGTTCVLTDKSNTIHFAATSALGSPLTASPTNGLLFTALFNVTGTSAGSQPIGYQSGSPSCTSGTSVSGLCVTISNGSPTPLVETAQTATFNNSNSATMPSVVVSANVTSFGPQFPGVSDHVNITATPGNGYMINSTNSVQFSSISSTGLTVTLSPSSCSTPGVPCSSVLTIMASAAGNYSVKVAGSYPTVDSSGNHDTLLSLVNIFVDVYDFGFTISPTATSFLSGEIGSTTVSISSQNGFAGAVSLSTSVNVPAGLTVGYVPTQLTLSAGQTLTSTVTFKASPASQTTYHVKVNAAFGSRVKTSALLTVTVTAPVPDFYIFAAPTSLGRVDAGVAVSASVIVGYANGFTGTVNLSVAPPSLGSLNMTSLTGSGHNVTLTASSTVARNYSIVVTAMNSTVNKSVTFTLSVVDFNLTAAPNPIQLGRGSWTLTTVTVVPLNSFPSTVSLTSVQSTGLSATLTPSSIVASGTVILNVTTPISTALGAYTVNVTGTSATLQHTVQVNVTVVPADFSISATPNTLAAYPGLNVNSTITLTSMLGFFGPVTLSIQAPSQVTGLLNATTVTVPKGKTGVAILTLTSTASGTFSVSVNATTASGLKHSVTLSFTSNTDVTVSITNPYSQVTLSEGSTGSVPVTVTSQNGFTGTITLAYNIIKPPGFAGVDVPNATLTPSTLSLVPNFHQNITVTITVRNSVVGPQIFGLNVTATIRSLVVLGPTMTVNVAAPGFLIASNPSPAVVGPGGTASFTVNVTAVGGLFGIVNLSPANLPSGVTCSPSSVSLLLKRDRSNITSISCAGPVGSSNVTIAGTGTTPYGSTLPESGTARLVVASFSLSSIPTSFPLNTGQQGNARINVTWTNNFQGNATITLTPQTGLTATIDSSKLTGSGSTMVHVSSNTAGTYSLVVNATSGSYSKSVTLTVTVSAVSPTSIDPVILYSGIGVGVVAVIAAAFLLLRRGKRSKTK